MLVEVCGLHKAHLMCHRQADDFECLPKLNFGRDFADMLTGSAKLPMQGIMRARTWSRPWCCDASALPLSLLQANAFAAQRSCHCMVVSTLSAMIWSVLGSASTSRRLARSATSTATAGHASSHCPALHCCRMSRSALRVARHAASWQDCFAVEVACAPPSTGLQCACSTGYACWMSRQKLPSRRCSANATRGHRAAD